jgi:hypothetical protein
VIEDLDVAAMKRSMDGAPTGVRFLMLRWER